MECAITSNNLTKKKLSQSKTKKSGCFTISFFFTFQIVLAEIANIIKNASFKNILEN